MKKNLNIIVQFWSIGSDFKSLTFRKKVIFILDRIFIFLVITFLIYDFCSIMYAIWKEIPYLFNDGLC